MDLQAIQFREGTEGVYCVIEANLKITNAKIWFGVSRKGFGTELKLHSPWRVFLENFAQIADAGLVRLAAERIQMDAFESQGLMAATFNTLGFLHQTVNLAKDIKNPLSTLNDAYNCHQLIMPDDLAELIPLMNESAERLVESAANIRRITQLDKRCPCLLKDAVEQVKALYDSSLVRLHIDLLVDILPELTINVPLYVIVLALANLVDNSKDAILKRRSIDTYGGQIMIETDVADGRVNCHITDDGIGIEPEVKDVLFKLGTPLSQPEVGGDFSW